MPSLVTQIFLVTVVAGGFEVTSLPPAAAVFRVTVDEGIYSVTYADRVDVFQVTLDEPTYSVEVQEATLYRVTWPVPAGRGIPGGGAAGQVLRKDTNASYDASWTDETVTSVGGQVGDVTEIDPTYIGQAGAAVDQVLGWDGLKWTPIDQTGGGLADAPSDGSVYGRQDGAWVIVSGSGAVDSVFGRTGAVTAQAGDYLPSQLGQDGALNKQVVTWSDLDGAWVPADPEVTSVNTQTGAVVLTTDEVTEGSNLYFTEARVNAASDVAANTAARHEHANKVELDLITDGDHDVRTDNPHGVSPAQIGAAEAAHTHPLADLEQDGATNGQVITWNDLAGQWEPFDLDDAPVASVNGQTGVVVLDYTDVGAAAAAHTHALDELTQSGATDGQVITWNNAAGEWQPLTPPAQVESVNGQTGVVVLDYTDVGAAPTSHSHVAADVTDFDTEVSANADVAANTAARHTHANKAELDLITDGDHDVRTDNPHGVDYTQTGAAAASHTHDPTTDLTQGGAATGEGLVWDGAAWAPAPVTAATVEAVYVSPAGSDVTGDGSIESPYATIQKGIDEASPGATVVCLGAGDFAENVVCTDGIDVVLPYSDLTLNDGDQLTLAANRVVIRRLLRTSGTGPMVVAANTVGYAILQAYEIDDDGAGDTLYSTNSAPLDMSFSQAFIGNGNAFITDDSTARHIHLRGEDIYLDAANTTAVRLDGGSTVLMTVHHIKELGAGIGSGTVFDINEGDINVSCQEVGAATLADIEVDGNLNISAQQAQGTVLNDGVYTYFYNELAGAAYLGTNLGMFLDAGAYRLSGLAGNDGAFLALGANGLLVPTVLDVGAETWTDDTEAFTDVTTTTEETVYSVTVDQDFEAGSVSYEVDVTFAYWRTSTARLYYGATLLDTQTYTGSGSPLTLVGSVVIDFPVTSGDEFTVTFETDVAPAFEPNRTDITGGFLTVTKTGNEATASWGGITGTITDQTDLMDEFLSRSNTDVYTPSADYHPATKKYVDDNLPGPVTADDVGGGTFPDTSGYAYTFPQNTVRFAASGNVYFGTQNSDHTLYFYTGSFATNAWMRWDQSEGGFAFSHDLVVNGTLTATDYAGLLPSHLGQGGAASGDLLAWNGSTWAPLTPSFVVDDITDWATADLSINSLTTAVRVTTPEVRITGTDMFLGYGAADGDRTIYFSEGGSDTARYLRWDDSVDRFLFNDDVRSLGNFWAALNLISDNDVYINYNGPEGDSYVYFYEGGTYHGAHLKWDNGTTRHEFSHALYVTTDLRAGDSIVSEGDIVAVGDIKAQGNLMSRTDFYVNSDGPDGDAAIYFYQAGSATGASLLWDDSAASFATSHDFRVNGRLVVDDGAADFNMILVSTDAAVGLQFADSGGTGDLWYNGNVGNGKFYFRDQNDTFLLQLTDSAMIIDDGMHFPYVTKMLNTRGPDNLVSNSLGDLGDNYNFSTWTYDPDAVYNEAGTGGFSATSGSTTRFNDEILPVDPTQLYELAVWMKAAASGSTHYIGVAPYDADGELMDTRHFMHFTNTQTTLAADLNPGDTVVQLTSAANWQGATGGTGIPAYNRAFVTYGYENSFGHVYDDYTYSRNHSGDSAWDDTGTAFSGNTLTLSTTTFPSGWDGPTIPAGTAIANASAGSSYKYIAASNESTPTDWTKFSGFIGGVDAPGQNNLRVFPPGCAGIKLLFLINRTAANTTSIFAPYFGPPALAWQTGDATPSLTLPGPLATGGYAIIDGLVRADSGEFNGLVNIDRGATADSCWLNLENDNVDSYLRLGDDSGDYGFKLWYMGTGSGVNNSLKLAAENQTGTDIDVFEVNQDGVLDWKVQPTGQDQAVEVAIDGGGAEIPDDTYVDVIMPYAMTIESWWLMADQSGSIDIGVWKDSWANFPPTSADEIVGPSITSAQNNAATGLSISVAKGDVLRINVDSCTTIQKVTLALRGVRA